MGFALYWRERGFGLVIVKPSFEVGALFAKIRIAGHGGRSRKATDGVRATITIFIGADACQPPGGWPSGCQ